jgi:hypothetical protein
VNVEDESRELTFAEPREFPGDPIDREIRWAAHLSGSSINQSSPYGEWLT